MKKLEDKLEEMGSYSKEDAIFLLKNIDGLIKEEATKEREKKIQSGKHYSEMLPIEYEPSEEYIELFHKSLDETAFKLASATAMVSEMIMEDKGENAVLVSLARAGTPIGVLIKRYIKEKYNVDLAHYSISIIRDKGIDENAVKYILEKHKEAKIQFVDGWTGKGTISRVLTEACEDYFKKHGVKMDDSLAVLADPGDCAPIYGTREDFLIPSACLNSTVSGLVSRTVLNDEIISEEDFHGAKYYKNLKDKDLSNYYVDKISGEYKNVIKNIENDFKEFKETYVSPKWTGRLDLNKIKDEFKIKDINFIKPGVGETTRVLLRRLPWKILVNDIKNPNLKHIIKLAEEKNVVVEEYKFSSYECCGIIKNLKDA